MILVTGSTGTIGREAVRLLAGRGLPTRALVRDAARAPGDRSWSGAEIAVGDFDRPDTLDAALRGTDTVLLISPSVPAQEIAVIDAAVRQGVRHIVKITNHKATAGSPVARRRDHARIEEHLRAVGLPHTLLAPNLLMQNLFALAATVQETDGFVMSAGEGRCGMVDARDVSAAAAAVAAAPSAHEGRTYLLTGPELVSYADVTAGLTQVLGRTIAYRRITPAEHREAMIAAGLPEPVATSNAQVFGLIAEGDAAWLSEDVTTLTGTRPRSLRTFLRDTAAAFTR
ncbi:NmrA family NAD(P)-binding protein [Streptomyces thermodiastaticus]|uniref:NmrA family NAD(P)-binding protein n=1 Tax=Streptomyces thermodiastaticus TaxID=44061 RepID=UPI001676092F|nr:NmrA family NAD(P)-binding protein [Streptomyces thermodiastaticus]MCE7550740.1 NmrA family NAD(P)-binding protein [Streptomyces thermodiastaticus]GHF71514.1 nucleotide-diphosphate-sugar epimerase [Streptomyces thermodiastaticus]